MNAIASRANRTFQQLKDKRYHFLQERTAEAVLHSIERQKGKTPANLIKTCENYAHDVLGSRRYAPWLNVYAAVQGQFAEGWIPDNYYAKVVVPRSKGAYGELSNLKPLNSSLLGLDHFPDLGAFVNSKWINEHKQCLPESVFADHLFSQHQKIVFKADSSLQGKAVYTFERANFSTSQIQAIGNGVFQHYIDQHAFFDEIVAGSVATIRITTLLTPANTFQVGASYLRVGRSADTHVKSCSHVRIPVDPQTGALADLCFLPDWSTTDRHPDTNYAFVGQHLPQFENCVKTVLQLHQQYPFVQAIGWDVAVDKNEQIWIMEWNGAHNDIKFSEATQGPCFRAMKWEQWADS